MDPDTNQLIRIGLARGWDVDKVAATYNVSADTVRGLAADRPTRRPGTEAERLAYLAVVEALEPLTPAARAAILRDAQARFTGGAQ